MRWPCVNVVWCSSFLPAAHQTDESRKAQAELDEKVERVKANLRTSQDGGDAFGGGPMDATMDFDDDKMRKSGRFKGRHVGSGGKHGARM